MVMLHERYVTDSNGQRVAVLLDINEYYALLNELQLAGLLRAPKAAQLSDAERHTVQENGLAAMQTMQQTALHHGLDQLSADAIEAEIQAVRAERRARSE